MWLSADFTRTAIFTTAVKQGQTVNKCRRGHERTAENTYHGNDGGARCLPCRIESRKRWQDSPRGRAIHAEADARYRATWKGYWRSHSYSLRQQRAHILSELDQLATEEA